LRYNEAIQDAGCRYRIQDTGYKVQDAGIEGWLSEVPAFMTGPYLMWPMDTWVPPISRRIRVAKNNICQR